MRLHRTFAAASIAAGVLASTAANAGARALEGELAPGGSVNSLRIVPTAGHADLVIGVTGNVTFRQFTLKRPDKIVVDVSNAALRLPRGDAYDHVSRGGITDVRYGQNNPTTVRVVITLDTARKYTVSQSDGEIHVSIESGTLTVTAWNLEGFGAEKKVAAAPAAAPAHEVAAKPAGEPRRDSTAAKAAPDRSISVRPTPKTYDPAKAEAEQRAAEKVRAEQKAAADKPPVEKPAADTVVVGAGAVMPAKSLSDKSPATVMPVLEVSQQGGNAQQQPRQPPITVSWENAPIADVLSQFAAFTGRTILPSKNVTGNITANIVNQPWDVALRAVLNANGFDVTEDQNGILIVDTFEHIQERQATVPLATRTIRLNYARAAAVAPMLQTRLSRTCPTTVPGGTPNVAAGGVQTPATPGVSMTTSLSCPQRGAVSADSITNSISITDVPFALRDLEEYARSLDLRQPQVNIKAKIVLVDRSQLEGLGLRYDIGTREQFFNEIVPRNDSTGKPLAGVGQVLLGGNTIAAMANATARVPSPALQLVYSAALGNFDFTTFLEAMQQVALLDVQAEPSASVLNNRTANLTAGTQVPIRVIDAGAGGTATGSFPRAQVQMQQTGVILQVTPSVTANRQVQMRVHVENSDVQFQASDVGAVFPTQKVDNEVLVADGETAVMGGLTQTTVRLTKSGLPLLMDLPIIGRLFSVTNRQESKRDLLILITPHIIDEGQSPPETSSP